MDAAGDEVGAVGRGGGAALRAADRAIIALLAFYILFAFTVERYWLVHADELVARSKTDLLARLFALYGSVDRAYYDQVSPFTRALEGINVFLTQPLNGLLIFAILRRRPYRYPLQLAVGAYLTYSVVLYFVSVHLDGYAGMGDRSPAGFALLVLPNLPWLVPPAWLAADAVRAITTRFRGGLEAAEPPVVRAAGPTARETARPEAEGWSVDPRG